MQFDLYLDEVKDFANIQREISESISGVEWQDRVYENYRLGKWKVHSLTDSGFCKNIIIDLNLKSFEQGLDSHIKEFCGDRSYNIVSSWLSKFDNGDHGMLHDHGNADIAGVYYYKTTGSDGSIYFAEAGGWPFTPIEANDKSHLTAEEGKIILFPGYASHGITMNTTDVERISLSFNIEFTKIIPKAVPISTKVL